MSILRTPHPTPHTPRPEAPRDAPSDESLMIRVRDGGDQPAGREAFDVLVRRHAPGLVQFICRYLPDLEEASSIAQETYLEVYRTRAKYEPRAAFRTWLYTIARFRALNEKRRRSRAPTVSLSGGAAASDAPDENDLLARLREMSDGERSPEEEALAREAIDRLRRALDALPDEARELVVLHRFHGMKYHEIARIVGRPAATVRATMHRVMKRLRAILERG